MTLDEVRLNIDRVDGQIREVFVERRGLADQVAQIKAQTEDVIYKPEREAVILKKQSENMDPHLVKEYRALIKRIMEISRKYQYGRTLELRDCFPFSFSAEDVCPKTVAMIPEELYLCKNFSRDQIHIAKSYDEIAQKIETGEVQAGMAVIEVVGGRESEALDAVLVEKELFINRCILETDCRETKKVVEFSDRLAVTAQHDRLKIVFGCPHISGTLGSILSMISDYEVNLTEIHSMPGKENETGNYRFFAELELNLMDKEAQALIYQLSCETQNLKILGSYYYEDNK